MSFEFCHRFTDTLLGLFENTLWKDLFKWSMIGLTLKPLSVLSFCVVGKVIEDILNTNFTSKIIIIPKHWYAWQLVYSYDVIDTNDNFHFLGIGEKLPSVLLRIRVALLKKCLNQNIKVNNSFIDIESWSTFVKLVGNSALKKKILSRMWRNAAFSCDRGIFLWFFSLFGCL